MIQNRNHAFKDLRPYVCTFRDCTHKKLFSSRTEWFNHEMQSHRSQWRCPFCSHGSIPTLELFYEHVRIQHMQQLPEGELETLSSFSRQNPKQFDCSSCTFCSNWETKLKTQGTQTVSLSRLRRYIGGHLEQLAFSVIRGLDLNQDQHSSDSSEAGEASDVEIQSVEIEQNEGTRAPIMPEVSEESSSNSSEDDDLPPPIRRSPSAGGYGARGWWVCCSCNREVDPLIWTDDCPDCGHTKCDYCTSAQPGSPWGRSEAYF